jgi:3-deoxy-D-manno-octulosonate 8-phosphate phosphatase (KDO 8-P phosphatase)
MSPAEAARRVRMLGLDVDGVLTDNAIYLGLVNGQRAELKRFDIQDGLGLGLLRGGPIEVVWVSGRPSDATTLRATELRIAEVIQVPDGHKIPPFAALLAKRGLTWDEVAFVGDDLADVPVLRKVGVPIAVANAIDEVKALAVYVTRAEGGKGAVREAVQWLLSQRGEWDAARDRYVSKRST